METIIYTVKKGDTLYGIARRFGTTVEMLTRYNGIIEPDKIFEGQILRIPVTEIPCKKEKRCESDTEYVVKKGDTLADIAVRFGSDTDAIAERNGIDDPDVISEGQALKIPVVNDYSDESYTVRHGDTLYGIAKQNGLTVDSIAQENDIADPDVITAGRSIRLPAYDKIPGGQGMKPPFPDKVPGGQGMKPPFPDKVPGGQSMKPPFPDRVPGGQGMKPPFPDRVPGGQSMKPPFPDKVPGGQGMKPPFPDKVPGMNGSGALEYRVEKGDTLWSIARRFGVTVPYLINLNRLCCPDTLSEGQIIIIRR